MPLAWGIPPRLVFGVSIDPDKLSTCLQVLAEIRSLPPGAPRCRGRAPGDGGLFKSVKLARRHASADAIAAADRAVMAATATGAAGPHRRRDPGPAAGVVAAGAPARARCCARGPATSARTTTPWSTRSTTSSVRAAPRSTGPSRDARTDLTGRRALLTGGRAKIGMYIALRLLRDGAHTTITTRFPHDAVRRFAAMHDSADWLHRLRVVGIDLRDPAQVVALADDGGRARSAGHPDQQRGADGAPIARLVRAAGRGRARPSRPSWWPCPTIDLRDAHAARATAGAGRAPCAALVTDPARRDRPGPGRRVRRRRSGSPPDRAIDAGGLLPDLDAVEQLDPAGARGRRDGTARGAAVQPDRAVHPGEPAAPGDGGLAGAAQVRRERVGDGGPVQPRLQGARASRTPTWPRPR